MKNLSASLTKEQIRKSVERVIERPILFSAEMVRAILDGRKTQTRRIVKDCHIGHKLTLLQLLDFFGGGGTCDSSEDDGLITTFVQNYDRKNDGRKPYKYTGLLVRSAACVVHREAKQRKAKHDHS